MAWARDNRFCTVFFYYLLAFVQMQLFFLSPDGDDVMHFVSYDRVKCIWNVLTMENVF